MNNDKRERARDAANSGYFLSLANSRASLTKLPTITFISACFLGLDQLFVYSAIYEGNREFQRLFEVNIVLIVLSALIFSLSIIKSLTFRYQIAFSYVLAIFALIMGYSLCLLALSIATMVAGGGFGMIYPPEAYAIFGAVALLFVGGSTGVHVFLLKKRLREGHTAKRTMGNMVAASSVYRSKSLWFIFAVAVIGPNVLTGGQHVMLTLGTLIFLFLASVLTSLPVEFGYLAYLKSKDRRFWEKLPPKTVVKRAQKNTAWKKAGKVALIIFGFFVALVVLTVIAK